MNFFIYTHEEWRSLEISALLIAEKEIPKDMGIRDRITQELDYLHWLCAHNDTNFIVSGDRQVNAIIATTPEALFNTIKAKIMDILGVLAD